MSAERPSEVEALAKVLHEAYCDGRLCSGPRHRDLATAEVVLASDWLADHDARVRAEEREQIAAAVEGAIAAHREHGNRQAVSVMAPLPDLIRADR